MRGRCYKLFLAGWCLLASAARAEDVQFEQRSIPPSIVPNTTVFVPLDSPVTTSIAPVESVPYRLVHWTLNGVPATDELGRAQNPAAFVIAEPVTAIARYTNAAVDVDLDGVADWYELHFFATLANGGGSDQDGDGFDLRAEFTRDLHPRLADEIVDGGIAARGSLPTIVIQDTNYVLYTVMSSPAGAVSNRTQVVLIGSSQTLPDVFGAQAGYRFGQWLINGERVTDELGRSVGGLTFALSSNSMAVAVFYLESEDTDGDGVPDWYEWNFFGTLANSPNSDTDGDGFSLFDEYWRDMHPGIEDAIADGGLSQRSSALLSYLDSSYTTFQLVSDPIGFVSESRVVPTNSLQAVSDVFGSVSVYRFTEWYVDGVRLADELGRSVGHLLALVTTNTTAVARYYREDEDTDADGVPDWFERHFYGTLVHGATLDADGDGFDLLAEYNRDSHPNLFDAIADGGISQRSSELTFIDLRAILFYRINSSPPGFTDETDLVPSGTLITTTNFSGAYGSYIFGHWEVNGVRQVDGAGVPLTQVTFAVVSSTITTAFFHLASADADNDGMPDWWENFYLGGPTTGDAVADADGDTQSNVNEYLAGTNPRLALSALLIRSVARTGSGWEISFPSVAGRTYRVEYATELSEATIWSVLLDDIAGDGSVIVVTDPTAESDPVRFYRVWLKQ
jgi:hypothetical protein